MSLGPYRAVLTLIGLVIIGLVIVGTVAFTVAVVQAIADPPLAAEE